MIPDISSGNSLCSGMKHCNITVSSPDSRYRLEGKITAAENNIYVTGISLERQSYSTFATALSNKQIECFSVEQQARVKTFSGHDKPISGIKFSHEEPKLLYTSSLDGSIRLWDMRVKDVPAQTYFDATDECVKPITAFDLSLDENYICGGTELVREDSFLIFWDRRTAKNLGGYWNCHTDDITQVKYHPYRNCVMASSSTDGLMNVFDLSHDCEDDSLQYTLNTGSSVSTIMWSADEKDEFCTSELVCTSHTEELQLWKVEEANPYILLGRDSLKKRSQVQVDYLIDTLYDDDHLVYLVSGERHGRIHIWVVNECSVNLWSVLNQAHSDDVRTVAWNPADKMMFTGGEDGVVCIWKSNVYEPPATNFKMVSSIKQLSQKRTKKPY